MTANITLSLLIGVLFGCGINLIMARGIVRAFLGVMLVSNGINLLFLVAGSSGVAPIFGAAPESQMSDPLPQAMTLTAIVITLALTGFVLALAHRAWQVRQSDFIADDPEDARIQARAAADDISFSEFTGDEPAEDLEDDPGGRHPAPTRGDEEARS
ncbi:Na(+)/H(+) antiporter subunit C [Mobilicoccus massiliensis]|uniref:Na(+)/H(+) antiporter subunit C n=1 Tax=Mobilicoccus massiliensis TaxID=1522310 RepID=UPI00058E837F|nr:Na(+)/H(+) antiporter subunit C [Mobilicoccus massiliensis]